MMKDALKMLLLPWQRHETRAAMSVPHQRVLVGLAEAGRYGARGGEVARVSSCAE